MFNIKGKAAIITCGNGGIGLGMARGLAKAGAKIVIAARNQEKSRAAVLDLQALGTEGRAIEVDVRDEQSVADMVSEANRQCGKIDILINNAGMSIRKPVQDLALEEWRQVLDTNLTSAFLCARAIYPYMKQNGGGKIINIGSMLSIFGSPYAPAYSSSKGGIVQLTKSMATAWAVDAIQVNAILPGWIDTELTQQARQAVCGLNERVIARTPAGKWGTADDLAGVAVFLASSASDFITGAAIPVDGGYSALA